MTERSMSDDELHQAIYDTIEIWAQVRDGASVLLLGGATTDTEAISARESLSARIVTTIKTRMLLNAAV